MATPQATKGDKFSKALAHEELHEAEVDVPTVGDEDHPPIFSFRKLWAFTGPGFLMSIAYVDPGNFESDLQAGAIASYKLLWVLWWATVLGLLFQLLAARLGVVTGKQMAEICRETYGKRTRVALWLMVELAIIGSDIQEVIGSAIALNIISQGKIPLYAGVLITVADTFTFLFIESAGVRKLEAFFSTMILVMAISLGVVYIRSAPDQVQVLAGSVIPRVPSNAITQAVGMIGAVIMPHNIYLHSALVQSRRVNRERHVEVSEANKYYAIESGLALFVSFLINMMVVSIFAKGFYDTKEATDLGLENAGYYLGRKYGEAMLYIWALGLLAAGQSSTMTGTYAGQFVMQGFLQLKIKPWKRVMITRSMAVLPAVLVALLAKPGGLDTLDEWLNVLQSVQLPFALMPVLKFTANAALMGKFKNGKILQVVCWVLSLIIIGTNIFLVVDFLMTLTFQWWHFLLMAVAGVVYLAFILYITIGLEVEKWWWKRTKGTDTADETSKLLADPEQHGVN